jgi:prolyl 4-hydroxylase
MFQKKNIIIIIVCLLLLILIVKNSKSLKENFINHLNPISVLKQNTKEIILHKNPDIILIKNFLSNEECDHIIKIGDPHVKKSEVCGYGGSRPDKNRTSMTAHIGKKFITKDKKDPILVNVLKKASNYGKLPEENIEPIQLVRYTPGQYFKPHYDYLDRKITMYKENIAKNGQRELTFFVYLNDVPDELGGKTAFPKLNKEFKGSKGDAVFWRNMVNGEDDKRMLHSGTELKKGIKYGLNIWVREKKYIG